MTQIQKDQIQKHRASGVGYTAISQIMGLPFNTVKSYCKRNNLGGKLAGKQSTDVSQSFCKKCGMHIAQTAGRKEKKFCSTDCRLTWWKEHPELTQKKAVYSFSCMYCNTNFTAYGNKKRKFCSHACYVADRFGKRAVS